MASPSSESLSDAVPAARQFWHMRVDGAISTTVLERAGGRGYQRDSSGTCGWTGLSALTCGREGARKHYFLAHESAATVRAWRIKQRLFGMCNLQPFRVLAPYPIKPTHTTPPAPIGGVAVVTRVTSTVSVRPSARRGWPTHVTNWPGTTMFF